MRDLPTPLAELQTIPCLAASRYINAQQNSIEFSDVQIEPLYRFAYLFWQPNTS